MILANHGIVSSSGGVSFDADALAFITTASITDNTQKTAINTLVTDLKTANIWTKMKALYPFVGGTASSHKFNLKDPRDLDAAFRLVFNGGWTHSSNGALPNGTNTYADTKLNPYFVLTNNNYHLTHYSRTQDSSSSAIEIGAEEPVTERLLALDQYYAGISAKAFAAGPYPNSTVVINNTNTKGFQIGSRTLNNLAKLYFNGVYLAQNTNTNTAALPGRSLFIGANNNSALSPYQLSIKETAFASIGDGLTDAEAAAFYTAVQAYQTTLSRNV